ncbi:MAG: glycosyltransferase family 87 protein [Paracoccaceae bacterium]
MIARLFARSGWIALALLVLVTAMGVANHRGIKLDFANYYDVGQKAAAGEFDRLFDPFAPIAGKPPFGNMSFLGPPLTAYLYIPLTWMDPRDGINAFKFAGALAQFAALFLIWRECRPLAGPTRERQALFFAAFAWAALVFQPLQAIFVVGGQTTPFAFLLATLGWLAFRRDRMVWAALAISGAVVLKPGFAIAAIILFFWSSNRFRNAAMLAGLTFVAASGLVLGPDINLAFFTQTASEAGFVQAPWMNSNPFGWVEALFVPPEDFRVDTPRPGWLDTQLLSLRLVGVALLIGFAFRIWRSGIEAAEKRSAVFLTALAAALVFSPTVWSHYLMLALPMIAVLIAIADRLPFAARVTLAVILASSVFQNFLIVSKLHDWSGFDSRWEILAIGLAKSAPLLLLAGLLLFARDAIAAALRKSSAPPALPDPRPTGAARV